ncbi:protein STICHEL [Cucumis melo]|uniref:Protein STICHEL n=1 Tax=Cucumis melo TaxID=3656 RepID=A0A1S3BUE0_CUCME|nr:protein STICHEL [Cucumis melo]
MAEVRVSDPSKLHLKKELTQIRKAARVLRDPGTTSSWKSPLSSSRSVMAATATAVVAGGASSSLNKNLECDTRRYSGQSQLEAIVPLRNENRNPKDKKIYLYNWKSHKSSSEKSATLQNEDRDGNDDNNDGSYSVPGVSLDGSLSDARNGGDSKSDTYLGDLYSSMVFRCGDANLVSYSGPSAKRTSAFKKKSKKHCSHLDVLSRHQQKGPGPLLGRKLLEGHPSLSINFSQDDSIEQSDDTEDYSNSEDFRRYSAASPLLLKLKHKSFHPSSKFLRNSRKEDSSYSYSTPALSTSSYNRYVNRNPSTVGSWDGTTTSINDADDEVDDRLDFPGRQGCGIPCYWSKRTPKHRGICGSCCSPSLSDTLRRKGSSILFGSQSIYSRRKSINSSKRRFASGSARGVLPLLTNSADGGVGSSIGTGRSDDELSTNFGELDLEALSRLDGRRWSSSCRSHEGLEIVALNGEVEGGGTPESTRSFSQKYRPMFFNELIGQNIVVQSLINAISRGRIAPVYLFQGPRGTGKTAAARIFAAALNCLAPEENKPCGYCRECTDFMAGKQKDLLEVDGTNKKGIDRIRYQLKMLSSGQSSAFLRYKVFLIDECHLLPSKAWLAFLKFFEEPPQRVVFIFITTDLDSVPRTIQSRCQKYLFNKIKDCDMVERLKRISADENLDVDLDALDLIAMNADGSLRDAETMLEQLSLLGKRITTSLVNELVGIVSDEKLLELLALAMSSNTAETVKRARELMDSGVDPLVLMSQLASLIMDIIAGTYNIIDTKDSASIFGGRSLSEAEVERLKHALKFLSEAEKQLRVSSERSTWFTATLLQLGSISSPDFTQTGSSRRQSCKTTDDDPSSTSNGTIAYKQKSFAQLMPPNLGSPASLCNLKNGNYNNQADMVSMVDNLIYNSKPTHKQFIEGKDLSFSREDVTLRNMVVRSKNSEKLNSIWVHCIERCHSKTLRQLLYAHGKLLSISESEGTLIAYIAFEDVDIKSRAERFLSSITNSMEMVLRCNVEVRIILLPDGEASTAAKLSEGVEPDKERKTSNPNAMEGYSNRSLMLDATYQSTSDSSQLPAESNHQNDGSRDRRQEIPMQRIESIIREQRLETAWLQAMEKGTPGSLSRLKPEKNQVLPQDGSYYKDQMDEMNSTGGSSRKWEDELNRELKVLKVGDDILAQKEQVGRRADRYAISPSILHDGSMVGNSNKDNLGYESSSAAGGCSGLFCWNNSKPHKRGKVRANHVRSRNGRFSLFGECGKSRNSGSRFRRQTQ